MADATRMSLPRIGAIASVIALMAFALLTLFASFSLAPAVVWALAAGVVVAMPLIVAAERSATAPAPERAEVVAPDAAGTATVSRPEPDVPANPPDVTASFGEVEAESPPERKLRAAADPTPGEPAAAEGVTGRGSGAEPNSETAMPDGSEGRGEDAVDPADAGEAPRGVSRWMPSRPDRSATSEAAAEPRRPGPASESGTAGEDRQREAPNPDAPAGETGTAGPFRGVTADGTPAEGSGVAGQARSGGEGDAPADGAGGAGVRRPPALEAPREGGADDLKRIRGVGPKLEERLNELGFYHLDQVAAWSPAEVAWVDENLGGFSGRVSRDDWVGQARDLAAQER
ncbi:hypothetical protein [Roseitranquillus sediminis]|uniref:hypothetical protein n=1 Tax=Roseitranquillus sediminis TaxID=2809051 RepID=UPI001D0C93AB|nr:hypothetical protein [Roseitranquillus sediminis]